MPAHLAGSEIGTKVGLKFLVEASDEFPKEHQSGSALLIAWLRRSRRCCWARMRY